MVLKVIFPNGGYSTEAYTELGTEFSITTREGCPSGFAYIAEKELPADTKMEKECYAFLMYGAYTRPLYYGQINMLMSDTGFLFKDLTHK